MGLWYRFEVPDMEEMDRRSREAMLAGKDGYEQEFRVIDGGKTHWLRETVKITRTAPEYFWLVAVVTDVTPVHQAERAMRETDERFRLLIDSVQDYAILMLDAEGHVTMWNPGAE